MTNETNTHLEGFKAEVRPLAIPDQATRYGELPTAPKPEEHRGGILRIPIPNNHPAMGNIEFEPFNPDLTGSRTEIRPVPPTSES